MPVFQHTAILLMAAVDLAPTAKTFTVQCIVSHLTKHAAAKTTMGGWVDGQTRFDGDHAAKATRPLPSDPPRQDHRGPVIIVRQQHRRSWWTQRALETLQHPDARVAPVVALRRRYYYAAKATLISLQAVCMVYYLYMVLAYNSPATGMVTRLCEAYSLGMATDLFLLLTVVHIGLFVGHALALARMLLGNSLLTACRGIRVNSTPRTAPVPSKAPPRCPAVRRWSDRIFGSHGLLGFRSQAFDTVFLTRKVLQVSAQTVQARHFARLSSRPWLPALAVGMILANCWIGYFLRHRSTWSLGARRVAVLALEVVLDLLSLVVIPVALLLPYAWAYDPGYESFPLEYWYDDIWFVNLLLDAQKLFVASWYDLLYRVVFGVNLLMGIEAIKGLVVLDVSSRLVPVKNRDPTRQSSYARSKSESSSTRGAVRSSTSKPNTVDRVLVLVGLVVIGVHIHAQTFPSARLCSSHANPWFATQATCLVLELNCRDPLPSPPLVGTAPQVAAAFTEIDATSLLYLEIRHCPNLEIPPQIRDLHGLLGIKIYDATLVAWPTEAALTAATHPKLVAIVIAKTDMSAIPPGLLSPQFPQTVSDIEFAGTNLTDIPDVIADVWSDLFYLYIEASLLTTVPNALLRMKITELSLCGNNISRLPDEFFQVDRPFRALNLARNPLTLLPGFVDGSSPPVFTYLYAGQTQLTDLPLWIVTNDMYVEATGTPLCDNAGSSEFVDCETMTLGFYPFEFEVDVHQD